MLGIISFHIPTCRFLHSSASPPPAGLSHQFLHNAGLASEGCCKDTQSFSQLAVPKNGAELSLAPSRCILRHPETRVPRHRCCRLKVLVLCNLIQSQRVSPRYRGIIASAKDLWAPTFDHLQDLAFIDLFCVVAVVAMVLRRMRGPAKIFKFPNQVLTRLLAVPSKSQKNLWLPNRPLYWSKNVRNRFRDRVVCLSCYRWNRLTWLRKNCNKPASTHFFDEPM